MANYFRITAYHPAENVCAIFDSNGRFEKLWQFSSYLIQKGFKIIEVGADDMTALPQRKTKSSYAPAQRDSLSSMAAPFR